MKVNVCHVVLFRAAIELPEMNRSEVYPIGQKLFGFELVATGKPTVLPPKICMFGNVPVIELKPTPGSRRNLMLNEYDVAAVRLTKVPNISAAVVKAEE